MTPEEQTISEILYDRDEEDRIRLLSLMVEKRAIAFAEWMKKSAWSYSAGLIEKPVWKLTGDFLMLNPTVENKDYTSAELYTKFLQSLELK